MQYLKRNTFATSPCAVSRLVSFERRFHIDFENDKKMANKSLKYELWFFKYVYFVKDFRNSAKKYNIENAITSRHQHARCQECCHSKDNFT